jgi:hypothetical protein
MSRCYLLSQEVFFMDQLSYDRQTERQISASSSTRPAQSQMELNVGRFDPPRAAQQLGLAVGVLTVSSAGGWLCYSTAGLMDGWSLFIWWFGFQILLLAESVGLIIIWITVQEWRSYQRRLEEWHEVTLAAVENAGGVEQTSTYTVWELQSTSIKDVLLLALMVHRTQGSKKAHTIDSLKGQHWLGSNEASLVRLGEVSPSEAEKFGSLFASLGLIRGRGPKRAGEWVPESEGEVIDIVSKRWPHH